jgi:RNA polymerase sigma-70 factor (ECF subfamily)
MRALVSRAQAGDRAAFERLYRENVGRVYALCLRLSSDDRRAEELTQDVFVRAWRKLGTFRGDAAFSSWLHRLAVNVVYEAFRSEGRRRKRVVPTEDPSVFERPDASGRPGLGLDLERAIGSLPPGARSAFVLHHVEGYSYDEMSEMTGLAVGTLKAQAYRARQLLREVLG